MLIVSVSVQGTKHKRLRSCSVVASSKQLGGVSIMMSMNPLSVLSKTVPVKQRHVFAEI